MYYLYKLHYTQTHRCESLPIRNNKQGDHLQGKVTKYKIQTQIILNVIRMNLHENVKCF